ncbi:MAG: MAPEG family protein [Pseudomonadota bacterium]
MNGLPPEVFALTAVALFTGVLWVPIIINRLIEMGLWNALRNPQPDERPQADWAWRLANAHRNAIENLVVFAPLVLAIALLDLGNPLTESASRLFLASRVAHAVIYAAGIPLLRTIAFAVGFACQLALGLRLLGVV